jgi:hypothetical protein
MRACSLAFALLLAACPEPAAMDPDEAAGRAFFNRFITLGERDDAALAELYTDNARLHILRVFASGKTEAIDLSGAQWKQNIISFSHAPSHAPSSTFSQISVHREGQRLHLLAVRYSPSNCRTDEGYSMVIAKGARDAWQIVETSWEAWEGSLCPGADAPKSLAERLKETVETFASGLPIEIDAQQRLDSVTLEATRLVYHYTLRSGQPSNDPAGVCDAAELRAVIVAGGSILSHFVDAQGRLLGSTLVESCPGP